MSTTGPEGSPNAFETGLLGTDARSTSQAAIEELRQRGGIFVDAVRATRMAMALTDPNLPGNPIVFANQSFLDLSGYSMEEVLGQQPYFMNGPDTDPEDADRFRRILEEDRDGVVETIQYAKDGRRFVAKVLLTAFKDDDGRTLYHFLSWADATRRAEAEEDAADLRTTHSALLASEERLRLIVENARDYAIFTTDPAGRINQWYDGAAEVFGWPAEQAVGQMADITFTTEDRASDEPRKEREGAAADGRVPNVRWHLRKDGRRIFIEGIASALRDRNGKLTGFLKIGQDVTERRRAEEHQRILLAELQHRVRNIMATIRSVVRRTGETTSTVEHYVQHLQGRISAMARTQVLLTRDVHAAVDLEGLILDELEMQTAQPDQYAVTGPDVALPPKAAEVLGLAIHELATNSVKYGALSENGGSIDIRWALLDGDEVPQLSLIWSEDGVSITGAPSRKGFGTELVTERVPYELSGTGMIEFRTTGIVASIEFPLADVPSILQTGDGGSGAR